MKTKMYSITGIFFQERRGFKFDHEIINESVQLIAKIGSVMSYAMFFGIVGSTLGSESMSGQMTDRFGGSSIYDFKIEGENLTFYKKYPGRPSIFYKLHRTLEKDEVVGIPSLNQVEDREVWVGKYAGSDCGSGECKCIITSITESFFMPE